ncbi:putative holin-like toxin [Oceanobacillus sp. CFH 90083]|uniref:putative holin-like toxin n=1 Tax=Oceanobacillus sp. CFH 90083 TaxID=2592336 RepID=UPI001D140886
MKPLTVFGALVLMISFGSLIVAILSFSHKKLHLQLLDLCLTIGVQFTSLASGWSGYFQPIRVAAPLKGCCANVRCYRYRTFIVCCFCFTYTISYFSLRKQLFFI